MGKIGCTEKTLGYKSRGLFRQQGLGSVVVAEAASVAVGGTLKPKQKEQSF